ncbi:hypothetical protein Pla108_09850 [Botrimarina colliarenosi]|uniref:YetF C-terminal domain-containing protein n=1 Tax=Botrimarina colliarenosi TaxID=2528001 RepID=A0A5C6AM13_9BACT|nr:YetF domain-containing protein [Botrimarina colliarenosi]TWU00042.1 hypothetical protein Pla108_09850 [Botrimarina colliarenosi]
MISKWITAGFDDVSMVVLSAFVTYAAILVYTRLAGLRSFSKMSAADFAMTVAVGSLFASTIASPKPQLAIGVVALGTLFVGQWALSFARVKSTWFSGVVDNQPILLMKGEEILDDNLRRVNVTRADLYGKLREANAFDFSQVLAVIFETTGDISVLHSRDSDAQLDSRLLNGVVGGGGVATGSS